jgi:hypothetical protein
LKYVAHAERSADLSVGRPPRFGESPKFPASRENTGNFAVFGRKWDCGIRAQMGPGKPHRGIPEIV